MTAGSSSRTGIADPKSSWSGWSRSHWSAWHNSRRTSEGFLKHWSQLSSLFPVRYLTISYHCDGLLDLERPPFWTSPFFPEPYHLSSYLPHFKTALLAVLELGAPLDSFLEDLLYKHSTKMNEWKSARDMDTIFADMQDK